MAAGASYALTELVGAALAHGVPPHLMSCHATDVVPEALGRLDGAITDFFGFEVHLARPEERVDTLVCVKAETGGRERLMRAVASAGNEGWRRDLGRFLNDWSNPAELWAARVANIWLEFDLVAPQLDQPPPSLFFGNDRLIGADEPKVFGESPACQRHPARRGTERTGDGRCPRVLRCLPDGAVIFQIGQMLARPNAPLRLCIRDLPPDLVGPFLADLGLGRRRHELEDLLGRLAAFGGDVDLDLDVTDEIGARIGLEWSPPPSPEARLDAEAQMFAWLVEAGLCLPEKAAACRSWTALVHCRRHAELWPGPLMAGDGIAERRATSCIARYLHHVKIVAAPGGHREAKAYLACLHRFVPDKMIKDLIRANLSKPAAPRERLDG